MGKEEGYYHQFCQKAQRLFNYYGEWRTLVSYRRTDGILRQLDKMRIELVANYSSL